MSDKRTVAIRMPVDLIEELQEIANQRYPAGRDRGNFSQVVLDAIAFYLRQPESNPQPPTVGDDVLGRLEDLEKKMMEIIEMLGEDAGEITAGLDGYEQIKRKAIADEINNLFPDRPNITPVKVQRWLKGDKPDDVNRGKAVIEDYPEWLHLRDNYKLVDGNYWKRVSETIDT